MFVPQKGIIYLSLVLRIIYPWSLSKLYLLMVFTFCHLKHIRVLHLQTFFYKFGTYRNKEVVLVLLLWYLVCFISWWKQNIHLERLNNLTIGLKDLITQKNTNTNVKVKLCYLYPDNKNSMYTSALYLSLCEWIILMWYMGRRVEPVHLPLLTYIVR